MNAAALPSWLKQQGDDWLLTLHVQPGARVSEVQGVHGDALKIRLAAPPVDGKANAELLRFVTAQLRVPRRAAELVAGHTARQKRLRISGPASPAQIISALWDDDRLGPSGGKLGN